MAETTKYGRAAAEKYRGLARLTNEPMRTAYLVMADWWDDRALKRRIGSKVRTRAHADMAGVR